MRHFLPVLLAGLFALPPDMTFRRDHDGLPDARSGAALAQENPMTATSVPPDDEPEPQPEPQQPLQPGATPPVLDVDPGRRLPVVTAPLPPPRPFFAPQAPTQATAPAVPALPATGNPATSGPSAASPAPPTPSPAPPAAGAVPPAAPAPVEAQPPAAPPAVAALPDEPDIELTPNMRILSMPIVTQPSTTEEIEAEEERTPEPTLVEKQTDAVDIACLQPDLLRLVKQAGDHFGATPVITSGQRSRGRRNSYHRRCMAADFFVPGVERARLARYLRSLPGAGGVGTYCHTKSVHIDTGEPRNWWQCGFRTRFALR
ncbi:MAG: D-Ala-D-Ala carboxypeptidase family metallohydrolase [Beijerinckiaceae bacterium]|nr:D-Ala-D-Ala carboxypeptidase family metallohydrolase [Beijerinckiaceae bacterium]MCZ8301093.1 D-Ala-D-Ala carboxypeptidase family metallohydrolase [Beijerinckiaceae bacterium]